MAHVLEENTDFIKLSVGKKISYKEIAHSLQQRYGVKGLSAASVKKFVLESRLRSRISKETLAAEVAQATREVFNLLTGYF